MLQHGSHARHKWHSGAELALLFAAHADSDIDLGLFGAMHGCELEALTGQQAKKLLYSVLGSLQRARLPEGKVCVWQCAVGYNDPYCCVTRVTRVGMLGCCAHRDMHTQHAGKAVSPCADKPCDMHTQLLLLACCVHLPGANSDGGSCACAQVHVLPVRPGLRHLHSGDRRTGQGKPHTDPAQALPSTVPFVQVWHCHLSSHCINQWTAACCCRSHKHARLSAYILTLTSPVTSTQTVR